MLKDDNQTHIFFILKDSKAKKKDEFRPISLCNITSKLIAKCMAKRIKFHLPKLISLNQSAFVLGRKIVNVILLS